MIYVVGTLAFDTILYCKQFPKTNAAVPITGLYSVYGGAAGNTAAVLGALGEKVSLVSVAGDDFRGSDYESHLHSLGVDTAHVRIVDGEYTPRAYMMVDEKNDLQSYFFWGASGAFSTLLVPKLKLAPHDIIHIATSDPAFNRRLVTAYEGATISFDVGYDVSLYSAEDLEFLFRRVTHVSMNEHELRVVLAQTGKASAADILSYGPQAVTITYGSKGSTVFTSGGAETIGTYAVERVADPTGAGDAYRAGFVAGLGRRMGLKQCAKAGAAAASFVIEGVGAQSKLPSWDGVVERMARVK